jgi:hypothetical protein
MHAAPNFPTLGENAGAKVKLITEKIRGISDTDIEKLLLKGEGESSSTTIEDVHIVYRVAKQTQFEATAEEGI